MSKAVPNELVATIYTVIVQPANEGGYWAECPQLEGAFTQGETILEVKANMYEAVSLLLEDMPLECSYSLAFKVNA